MSQTLVHPTDVPVSSAPTAPLLGPSPSVAHEMRPVSGVAASFVAQTYWAATGHIWKLRNVASQLADDEQRNALLDLIIVEEARQATARALLVKVWGIDL